MVTSEFGAIAEINAPTVGVQDLEDLIRQRDAVIADLQERVRDSRNVVNIVTGKRRGCDTGVSEWQATCRITSLVNEFRESTYARSTWDVSCAVG
jgi:hypothetical protein